MSAASLEFDILPFLKEARFKSIKKGTYLMKQNEIPKHIYYLKKGICYISSISQDGTENIYWYFKQGDFPSISPVLTQYNLPDLNIRAKTDCQLYYFTKEEFNQLFQKYPDFAWNVVNVLLNQMNFIVSRHNARVNLNTPSRICYALLELANKKTMDGKEIYTIDKSYTQAELAKYVGVHHVTFSLILKKLKELGAVKVAKGIRIVDINKLKHYIKTNSLDYKECRNATAK